MERHCWPPPQSALQLCAVTHRGAHTTHCKSEPFHLPQYACARASSMCDHVDLLSGVYLVTFCEFNSLTLSCFFRFFVTPNLSSFIPILHDSFCLHSHPFFLCPRSALLNLCWGRFSCRRTEPLHMVTFLIQFSIPMVSHSLFLSVFISLSL